MTHADHWQDGFNQDMPLPKEYRLSRSRIMYIDAKSEDFEGEVVIGRVFLPKSGKTLYYRGLRFQSLKGASLAPGKISVTFGQSGCLSAIKMTATKEPELPSFE